MKEANEKGLPYDIISIIVPDQRNNNTMYGASIIYQTSNPSSPPAWVHELGHVFGRLHHEKINESTFENVRDPLFAAIKASQVLENCYGGEPPAKEWEGMVGREDYVKGCTLGNLYSSSSEGGNMRMWDKTSYFNAVSQKIINQNIDSIAGNFRVDQEPPKVKILSPQENDSLTGDINIKSTASDDRGIAYVQFWVDGILIRTSYVSPYDFVWHTAKSTIGKHIIDIKAYDVSGNMGEASSSLTLVKPSIPVFQKVNLKIEDGTTLDKSTNVSIDIQEKNNIQWIEVHADDRIYQTISDGDLKFNDPGFWINHQFTQGKHKLSLKAYDYYGDAVSSKTITVNLVGSNFKSSVTPTPTSNPALNTVKSQNIISIPPEPTVASNVKRGKGKLSGFVFSLSSAVISGENIKCSMYIFLKDDSSGKEIKRLIVPVFNNMGRQTYMFDGLDTSEGYTIVPTFYGCDGVTDPPESYRSKRSFDNLLFEDFQDFLITYLADIPSLAPDSSSIYSQCLKICDQGTLIAPNSFDKPACVKQCDSKYKQSTPTLTPTPKPTNVPVSISPAIPILAAAPKSPIPSSTLLPTTVLLVVPSSSTPTSTLANLHSLGDASGDGKIDFVKDYVIWRDEITGELTTKTSDFNNDGIINTDDYSIWRDSMNNPNLPH